MKFQRPTIGILIAALFSLLLHWQSLEAQRLQDETLSHLRGGTVYPQDRVLGLMYIPEQSSQAGQEIFGLLKSFWNGINAGTLNQALLSDDGKTQIEEQVAPFIRNTPLLYRESLKPPADQFQQQPKTNGAMPESANQVETAVTPDAQAIPEETKVAKVAEGPPPTDYLRLSRVRLNNPIVEDDYARVRCRLEINDNSAFIQVNMFLLQESESWKVDALDIDWDNIIAISDNQDFAVFGRKRELYP